MVSKDRSPNTPLQLATRQIIEEKKNQIARLFGRYPVTLAFLFGSSLLETDRKGRDLDIGVVLKNGEKYDDELYTDLHDALCRLFMFGNIDLVFLPKTPPAFRFQVVSDGELLFSAFPEALETFLEEVLFDYTDTLHFRREVRNALHHAIHEGLSVAQRPINRERIETFLRQMQDSLLRLNELQGRVSSLAEFESNRDVRELCLYHLRIALESVLDIARHIIAVRGFGIADLDTLNLLDVLGQQGVLPSEFVHEIRGMAGMRNILVHLYWQVDFQKVYEMITTRLGDFDQFARFILEYLESDEKR